MASSPDRPARLAQTAVAALVDGGRRAWRAPAVWFGVWALTLLVALPLGAIVRSSLSGHLGASTVADAVGEGADWGWWQEFQQQASGLATTFVPGIIGGAAPVSNLSALADRAGRPMALGAALAAWLLMWSFVSGGMLDRLARDRPVGAHAFVTACNRLVLRLLRLGALAVVTYWWLFTYVHHAVFDVAIASWVRDLTVERTAFVAQVVGYVVFGLVLVAVNLVFDYARIRLVVEDRRSVVFALAAGARFVRRHVRLAIAVYALNALLAGTVIGLYVALAPGARNDGLHLVAAFAAGQVYILARAFLKTQFLASQTSVFLHALAAHALPPLTPDEVPDSPALETIRAAAGHRASEAPPV